MRGYDRAPTERDTDVVGDRILAVFVDGIVAGIGTVVLLVVLMFLLAGLTTSVGTDSAFVETFDVLFGSVFLLTWIVGPFAYWLLLEGLWDGYTVGKKVAGIKVVMDDGSECTMLASTIRNVVRVIDLLPQFYVVGLVAMLASDRRRRVGDIAAGTVVVEDPPDSARRGRRDRRDRRDRRNHRDHRDHRDDGGRERDRARGRGRGGNRHRERMVSERGRGRGPKSDRDHAEERRDDQSGRY